MKLLVIYGTRPEYLKLKNIIEQHDNCKTLHVRQHTDIINFKSSDFNIIIPESDSNRLDFIFQSIFSNIGSIIENFDAILIQGDTATVAACALAAFHHKKTIIHLEAGLRTYDLDNPYPEEGYRQIVSRLANIHLCPTKLSAENLIKENISSDKIYIVGNTSLDNLITIKDNCSYGDSVLITLHRNENVKIIDKWFEAFKNISEKFQNIDFIFPCHPNPRIKYNTHLLGSKIKVIPALEHNLLISILKDCKFIITDSGGLQEESSFLGKKCIVCRKTTERPEGIYSGHSTLCEDPKFLEKQVDKIINNFIIKTKCPYGDGQSSSKIVNDILNKL